MRNPLAAIIDCSIDGEKVEKTIIINVEFQPQVLLNEDELASIVGRALEREGIKVRYADHLTLDSESCITCRSKTVDHPKTTPSTDG